MIGIIVSVVCITVIFLIIVGRARGEKFGKGDYIVIVAALMGLLLSLQ